MNMNLVSALILIGVGLLFIVWGAHDLKRYFDHRHVAAVGETTVARVLSLQQTGTRVNQQPEVRVELEIMPVGAAPFRAEVTAVVSQVKLASMAAPGAVVRVRFDPKDRTRLVLD